MTYVKHSLIALLLLSFFIISCKDYIKTREFAEQENYVNIAWTKVLTVYQRQFDMFNEFISTIKTEKTLSPDIVQYVSMFERDFKHLSSILQKPENEHDVIIALRARLSADFRVLLKIAQQDGQFSSFITKYQEWEKEIAEVTLMAEITYDQSADTFNRMINKFPNNIIALLHGVKKAKRLSHADAHTQSTSDIRI